MSAIVQNISILSLYFHTLKNLKWKQIFFRIYFRVLKRKAILSEPISVKAWPEKWKSPEWQSPSLLERGKFLFLNELHDIKSRADWNNPDKSKLWLYNLHYLDDLNSTSSEERREDHSWLISEWIKQNPPFAGNGWEPYTLSLRLVNLIKYFSRTDQLQPQWLESLGLQAAKLLVQIEYHILGNHLFANAKALVFCGTYLKGPLGIKCLRKGLKILDSEIEEQFLKDGAHFELSPMYHSILLWDICDLINLAHTSQNKELLKRLAQWERVIKNGMIWLECMVHPDQQISFFNDSAFDIAPTLGNLRVYLQQLKIQYGSSSLSKINYLKDSGYISIHTIDSHKLIIDAAEIGPKYQPGHAHADSLSFELSLFGQRVFVNSGTSQYGLGPLREWQRSTAAHNTIVVDGENSSEIWSGFRVARRAHAFDQSLSNDEGNFIVQCSHDGYKRLKGRVIHKRQWNFGSTSLTVADKLAGKFNESHAHFYLHPEIIIEKNLEDKIEIKLRDGQIVLISFDGNSKITIVDTEWASQFGKCTPNKCIKVELQNDTLVTKLNWKI